MQKPGKTIKPADLMSLQNNVRDLKRKWALTPLRFQI